MGHVRGDVGRPGFQDRLDTVKASPSIGNHQGSTGRLNSVFGEHSADKAFELFTTMAERHSKRQMDPAEVSSFWVERTLEEIADDPGRFAFLLWKKTLYGLNDFETPDNLDPAFLEEVTPFLAFPFPGFGFLLVLGLLGIISLWRNDTPGARSVHVVVAATWITMLVFFVSGRYRALMLPALAISAGYCVETFRRKISLLRGVDNPAVKKRIAAQLALFGFFAAGLATLTSLPILHPVHEVEFVKLSDSYVAQGDKAKAAALLEELVNRKSGKGNERLRAWASKRARQLASPEETQ